MAGGVNRDIEHEVLWGGANMCISPVRDGGGEGEGKKISKLLVKYPLCCGQLNYEYLLLWVWLIDDAN